MDDEDVAVMRQSSRAVMSTEHPYVRHAGQYPDTLVRQRPQTAPTPILGQNFPFLAERCLPVVKLRDFAGVPFSPSGSATLVSMDRYYCAVITVHQALDDFGPMAATRQASAVSRVQEGLLALRLMPSPEVLLRPDTIMRLGAHDFLGEESRIAFLGLNSCVRAGVISPARFHDITEQSVVSGGDHVFNSVGIGFPFREHDLEFDEFGRMVLYRPLGVGISLEYKGPPFFDSALSKYVYTSVGAEMNGFSGGPVFGEVQKPNSFGIRLNGLITMAGRGAAWIVNADCVAFVLRTLLDEASRNPAFQHKLQA